MDLTIFIPTAGRTVFLAELFDSLQLRGDESVEVLVGYHGCEESMADHLARLPLPEAQRRCYHLPKGGGIPANWNEGVRQARGRYIFVMGDDDRFSPGGLHRVLESAKLGQADVLAFQHRAIDGKGGFLPEKTTERSAVFRQRPEGRQSVSLSNGWPPIFIMSSIFRTDWLRSFPFRLEAGGAADFDLSLRALVKGYDVIVSYDTVVDYRLHAASYSESRNLAEEAIRVFEMNSTQIAGLAEQTFYRNSLAFLWRGVVNNLLRAGDFDKAGQFLHEQGHRFVWHVRLRLWLKCRLRIREFKRQKFRQG